MSRLNFQNEREKQVLLEGWRLAVEKATVRPRDPVIVRCEDPRIRALLDCLANAERWLESNHDSDMTKHFLELLGIQAFLLAESICGNTKFIPKAA